MLTANNGSEARIRARNKAKILKAAVELFSLKGYEGTRIAEISKASGLPKANIYYYFETKEAIYATLIDSLFAGWDKALEHIDAAREPEEAIRDYIRAKLDYSRKHLVESRFFANEMLRGGRFPVTQPEETHAGDHEGADCRDRWMDPAGQDGACRSQPFFHHDLGIDTVLCRFFDRRGGNAGQVEAQPDRL